MKKSTFLLKLQSISKQISIRAESDINPGVYSSRWLCT